MKKILFGALFIASSVVSFGQDMTVDGILENYYENIGGKDAWMALKSYQMNASADAQGMKIPVTVIAQKDGKTITKFSFQGTEFVQGAFDGESMWSINFMTQKPEKSESEEVENYKKTVGEFPDPLLTYKEMGYELELVGEDTKDGVDCYKLKMNKGTKLIEGEEKENIVYYYMDKENYIPIMQEQPIQSGQMAGKTSQTLFSDYQEVGDGMYYPFSITSQVEGMGGQTIVLDSLDMNPEIDQTIFNFPAEEEE